MNLRHTSSHKIICWRFTRRCNRTCSFCLSASGPREHNPTHDIQGVLERLVALGTAKVSYSGGEPTLHPEFSKALEIGANLGLDQILTTNGDILIRRSPPWLTLLQYVKVSFYGGPTVHNAIMGGGHYEALMETATRETRSGRSFGANFVLSKKSINDLAPFLEDASRNGFRHVLLLTYMPVRRPVDEEFSLSVSGTSVKEQVLKHASEVLGSYADRFAGSLKIHDYSIRDFFVVLDENEQFTLPRLPEDPFVMGGMWEAELALPDGRAMPAAEALGAIWNIRAETPAIISTFD